MNGRRYFLVVSFGRLFFIFQYIFYIFLRSVERSGVFKFQGAHGRSIASGLIGGST